MPRLMSRARHPSVVLFSAYALPKRVFALRLRMLIVPPTRSALIMVDVGPETVAVWWGQTSIAELPRYVLGLRVAKRGVMHALWKAKTHAEPETIAGVLDGARGSVNLAVRQPTTIARSLRRASSMSDVTCKKAYAFERRVFRGLALGV